jgi:hypothetical protein
MANEIPENKIPENEPEQLNIWDSLGLEEPPKDWEKEWVGMPEFVRLDMEPFQRIIVNFRTKADVKEFAKKIGQNIGPRTDTIWFPPFKTPTGIFVDKSRGENDES